MKQNDSNRQMATELAQLEQKLTRMIKAKTPSFTHTEEKSLKALENRLNAKIRDAVQQVNDVSFCPRNFNPVGC